MARITIKDLVKDVRTSTGYRDKDTGQFVSKVDVDLFLSWMEIKERYKELEPKIPTEDRDRIQREIDDLEDRYDDDEYEQPHEYFKIKYPEWSEMDESVLRKIAGRYFLVDNLTTSQKKKGIRKQPSNVMAMKYTLTKLKIEKMQKDLDRFE